MIFFSGFSSTFLSQVKKTINITHNRRMVKEKGVMKPQAARKLVLQGVGLPNSRGLN